MRVDTGLGGSIDARDAAVEAEREGYAPYAADPVVTAQIVADLRGDAA